jgi:hypothetical protein
MEIDKDVLISVFLDWIERPEWVIENERQYYNGEIKDERKMLPSEPEMAMVRTF